ncbi:1502_t:CDS:2, partial [Funneliformis geosporum]
ASRKVSRKQITSGGLQYPMPMDFLIVAHACVPASSILDVVFPTPAGRSITIALCKLSHCSLRLPFSKQKALHQASIFVSFLHVFDFLHFYFAELLIISLILFCIRMDFENPIVNYFRLNDYTKWSVFEVLRYISNSINFTSENVNDISESLKRQLEILSSHKSLRVAARNKATKLLENLRETLANRREILNFIESQDLKFAENRYKLNVELSVVTDKTAMTGKTTEKFARSLNDNHDIRGSGNQDSSTETQTSNGP